MKTTARERQILKWLSEEGVSLQITGNETVRVGGRGWGNAHGWTTRKTVRGMVAKGLLTREWTLPAGQEGRP